MTWLVSLLGQLPGFRVRALFVSLFLELGVEAAMSAALPFGRVHPPRLLASYDAMGLWQLWVRE